MRKYIIQPFLALLALLFCISLSNCGSDIPEHVLPTKKIEQCQQAPIKPPPAPSKPTPPPPPPQALADPEIAADPKVLRVGVFLDAPPFVYQKDKKTQGLEADLAQQLGTFSGKTVQFVKVPEKRATEALLKGYIDIIMSGRKIGTSEDCNVIFSEPYLRGGQILLIRSRDTALFSTGIYSLENSGFTLGVIQGSAGDLFLTRNIHGIRILRFQKVDAAIQALALKKIDLFLHDAPTICYYAAASKPPALTPILTLVTEEYLGWEMRKEDEKLRQQANHFIRQSKADGRLQKTIKQWTPNL
ncbi:MAG: transporter substrate-binding domain-containing protein [Deltaproteobacteria bacterium]|nr:transporter substrate-binding domain-containing protein [Deltaproteobacteria bacterium]